MNAAVKTAWAALVDDAERLAQGAIKNADLLLQIGRGRRTAALAADLAEAAGTDVHGAEHAAGVLAGLLDCYLLQQLGEKLHAQEQPEIGPLKDLPEVLHEVEAGKAAALAAAPAAAGKNRKKRKKQGVQVEQGEQNPYARHHQSYRRGSRSKR